MIVRNRIVLSLVCLLHFSLQTAAASDVYINADGNETGQGMLRQRNTECLIITPAHVVENAFKLEVTTADRSKYPAELVELFPGDIAVVRLDTEAPIPCRHPSWSSHVMLNRLLGTEKQGELHTMLPDGSIRKTPVEIIGFDKYRNINVRPMAGEDTLAKGASGSPLYIGGQCAGMLISVTNNVGNVLRQDALANAVALFFEDKGVATKPMPSMPEANKAPAAARPETPAGERKEFSGTIVLNTVQEHTLNLVENSPIRIEILPTGDRVRFAVDLIDSANKVSCTYALKEAVGKEKISFPCTPLKTDRFTLRVTGTAGEGRYQLATTPIVSDAALRSEAHILQVDGDEFSGILVKKAVAEYKVKLYKNSPVRLNLSSLDEHFHYTLEIADSAGRIVFRQQYRHGFDSQTVLSPFTPGKNDTYLVRLLGTEGEGKYALKVQSIAFDAQLRGEANVIKVGDSGVSGTIAKDAVAEYRFHLEAMTPVRFSFLTTGDQGNYSIEIVDSSGKPVYRNPNKRISGAEAVVVPFTVSMADTYTLRLLGTEGECGYSVRLQAK